MRYTKNVFKAERDVGSVLKNTILFACCIPNTLNKTWQNAIPIAILERVAKAAIKAVTVVPMFAPNKNGKARGKDTLLGISKRGNSYLRCLLIQGAKAVVSRAGTKTDKLSQWINRIVQTRGHNRACVAYANKMARMAWAITVSGEEYSAV